MPAPASCIPLRSAMRHLFGTAALIVLRLGVAVRIVKTRKVAVTRPPLLRKMAARADFDDVYVLETPVPYH